MSSRVTAGGAAGAGGSCCTAASLERAGLSGLLRDLERLSEDHDTADILFLLGPNEEKVYAHRIILVARSLDTAGLQRRRPSTAPAPADKREEQIARKIEIRQKPSPAPPTQTMLLPKLLGPFVDSVTKELD
ncbi:hypothetical protein EVAR_94011_1 [Eumeta japonica]|uniref:BTB domain-containing protein n=1 Tax=Eumeta variegata TaxID=151549 RepID=A0A4C1TPD6_EUMVA|nr:hypothetical protein EVAR_94011_1 [Eumeta japonica]